MRRAVGAAKRCGVVCQRSAQHNDKAMRPRRRVGTRTKRTTRRERERIEWAMDATECIGCVGNGRRNENSDTRLRRRTARRAADIEAVAWGWQGTAWPVACDGDVSNE